MQPYIHQKLHAWAGGTDYGDFVAVLLTLHDVVRYSRI